MLRSVSAFAEVNPCLKKRAGRDSNEGYGFAPGRDTFLALVIHCTKIKQSTSKWMTYSKIVHHDLPKGILQPEHFVHRTSQSAW